MRRSCCGSRLRGVPDEFRIGREIRGLAERARTADDEYKEHLTTVNILTVGMFSVTIRNTASGLSPTASRLSSRVLPRRRPTVGTTRLRPSPANHSRSPLAGPTSTPQVPRCSLEVRVTYRARHRAASGNGQAMRPALIATPTPAPCSAPATVGRVASEFRNMLGSLLLGPSLV